jgi:electron-transferring-flavoprotein dehydrogenase
MQREVINVDVVIVGGGPSGIATAIHLKQLCNKYNQDISIAILEKGSSIGANLISGCVMDPVSLNELIPQWQSLFAIRNQVVQDDLYFLTTNDRFKLPHIKEWSNIGNYIISLSQLCIKLAEYAESLGIDIYPGFPVVDVIIENSIVVGVVTGDVGLDKDSNPTANFQPGIEIRSKQVVLAEGCRGSVTKSIINRFNLDVDSSAQTYGLGIKEIWQVTPSKHKLGKVEHYIGYPLNNNAYGGGFLYHLDNNMVAVGLVTALDYQNPYLSPFEEFQQFKLHPNISNILLDAKRLEYGARTVVEGGVQALPKLEFSGGLIVGDSAGFLNIAKIKGVHNAIKSGMLAAESIYYAILNNENLVSSYEINLKSSDLYKDLYRIRNIRPAFRLGLYFGMFYAAFEHYVLRHHVPWTFRLRKKDNQRLKSKDLCHKIEYPAHDGIITFDKSSSVHLSNISHDDTQPCHLKLGNPNIPIQINLLKFASPETRYCPAGVYEIIKDHNSNPCLLISSQNCVHCKACDIKDPLQNINWVPPEAGSGPQYSDM